MSRPRLINDCDLLDAAEAVVARDGATRLTLEAVAAEAGISKARVIYDYKTKQALIRALIQRRIADEDGRLCCLLGKFGGAPNAQIRSRISLASDSPPNDTQAVAVSLCSATTQDAELMATIRQWYSEAIAAVLADSPNPRTTMIAFLAVEGLRVLEYLGLHSVPIEQRKQILRDIESLVAECPDRLSEQEHSG